MEENKDCGGCGQPLESTNDITTLIGNVKTSSSCQGCSGNKFSGKLGTCVQCMLMSSFGMIFGWATYFILFLLNQEKNVQFALLAVASFFTLLLFAHGIAYLIKRSTKKG